jgi:membrane protease YdiL (CAAX protease family)
MTIAFIRRHPVLTYYAIALVISWGGVVMAVGLWGLGSPEHMGAMPVYVMMLLGPTISGLLMTGLVSGKAGFRDLASRLLRWRVSAYWYLAALLLSPVPVMVALLALSLFSPEFLPIIFATDDWVTLVMISMVVGLLIGLTEETGWTGYAIPQLRRRYGILITGLIAGFLWGLWHFIVFYEKDSFTGIFPMVLLVVRLFTWLPAYRVLMVWIYDRTASLLVIVLMHISLVTVQFSLIPTLTGTAVIVFDLAWAAALWIVVVVVTTVSRCRLSGKKTLSQ